MIKNNIANCVTLTRILLIPVITGFFFLEKAGTAAIFFFLASITDGLDGYLARHFNQTSALGVWLDPVADKLIIVSTLILLLSDAQFYYLVGPTIIIVCREVTVSALREWMATIGKAHVVRVSQLGKSKTALQMIAIFLCLLSKAHPNVLWLSGMASLALGGATCLTLLSLMQYVWQAYKVMH